MNTSLITTLAAPNATASFPRCAGTIFTIFAGSSNAQFLTVLLKGSRKMQLEKVAEGLAEYQPTDEQSKRKSSHLSG